MTIPAKDRQYGLPHLLKALLVENVIDGTTHADLYEALLTRSREVQGILDHMLVDLVIDNTRRIAVIHNKPPEALLEIEDAEGLLPLDYVMSSNRMTYWESCAAVFLRKEFGQDEFSGSTTWFDEERLVSLLKKDYPRHTLTDDKRLSERLSLILRKLESLGLAVCRNDKRRPEWRATPQNMAAIPASEIDTFNGLAHQIVTTAQAQPKPEEPEQTGFDLDTMGAQ